MFGWLGFFALVIGFCSLAALSRSTAKRRPAAGAKEFKGYWEKTAVLTFELTVWLYGVSSITAGIIMLGYQFYFKK